MHLRNQSLFLSMLRRENLLLGVSPASPYGYSVVIFAVRRKWVEVMGGARQCNSDADRRSVS